MDGRRSNRDLPNPHPRYRDRDEQHEEEYRMLPCRFFVNGFCVNGSRCRFYHPSPAFLPLTLRVPPFPPDFGVRGMAGGNFGYAQRQAPLSSSRRGRGRGSQYIMDRNFPMNFRNPSFEERRDEIEFGLDNNAYYSMVGEEGDAPRNRNPNFRIGNRVTSTYANGLMSYQYQGEAGYNGRGHQQTYIYEEDKEIPLSSPSESQTLFTHINWAEFLLPGKSPPPYVSVPLDDTEDCARGKAFLDNVRRCNGEMPINNDMPPEGCCGSTGRTKMTPKEELHLKVQEIAKELEKETGNVPKIRSLDSFFENYDKLENLPPPMIIRNPETRGTSMGNPAQTQLTDTDDGPSTSDDGQYSDEEVENNPLV